MYNYVFIFVYFSVSEYVNNKVTMHTHSCVCVCIVSVYNNIYMLYTHTRVCGSAVCHSRLG